MAASNYGPHSYDSLRKAMNETTASEREAFNEFAAANAGILFTGTITADQAPFYMAIWSAACRWQAARAALPAPADQLPEPQGSSGSLSESGAEAGPQDAASAFVLVPRRLTRAMQEVIDEEGWTWEDLLAAAEAITEAEHTELSVAASETQEIPGYVRDWIRGKDHP